MGVTVRGRAWAALAAVMVSAIAARAEMPGDGVYAITLESALPSSSPLRVVFEQLEGKVAGAYATQFDRLTPPWVVDGGELRVTAEGLRGAVRWRVDGGTKKGIVETRITVSADKTVERWSVGRYEGAEIKPGRVAVERRAGDRANG